MGRFMSWVHRYVRTERFNNFSLPARVLTANDVYLAGQ
jgi:hypothetical protein